MLTCKDGTHFVLDGECYTYDTSDFNDTLGSVTMYICANGNTLTANGTLYLQSETVILFEL